VRGEFMTTALVTAGLALGAEAPAARADGGAVRAYERRDDRLIAVFTAPTPIRVGFVDVSILVQDANSGSPLPDGPIVVHAHPIHDPRGRISVPATSGAATNKLLRAARLELSEPGRWHVEVVAQGVGQGPIGFDIDVAEAQPPWLDMTVWIGWPLVAIGLFAVHQWLVHRRSLQASRPAPGGGRVSIAPAAGLPAAAACPPTGGGRTGP
jgi:hypothetical protein